MNMKQPTAGAVGTQQSGNVTHSKTNIKHFSY